MSEKTTEYALRLREALEGVSANLFEIRDHRFDGTLGRDAKLRAMLADAHTRLIGVVAYLDSKVET